MGNALNMNERRKWIEYKGQKILMLDASNLKPEEFEEFNKANLDYYKEIFSDPDHPDKFFLLVDMTNTHMTGMTKSTVKEATEFFRGKNIRDFGAFIGMSKALGLFTNIILRGASYAAKDLEDAKEWLYKKSLE